MQPKITEDRPTRESDVLCSVQEGKRGQTVLHEAADRCDMDIVRAVLRCRWLDINQMTYDGLTAVDMAIARHWREGQRLLVNAGGRTGDELKRNIGNSEELADMGQSIVLMSL